MDNKYRYGKYGLLWQDIYELFQKITDRCFDEGPDMINKLVEEFFEEHKSDPLFQEAFHRWCDVEEDYEEIATSRCINCSQSGKLYKNRLKDMVREGQLEGADAGEFMLDLIDSISDQKAKELCIDYGVPISEEDVESVTSASCITSASAPMAALEDIAKKYSDTIADRGGLQERGNDSEDFIELSVWTISAMLKAAYVLGQSSQSVESASTINSSATRLGKMAADISDRIQTFIEQVRPVASGYLTREDLNTLLDATDVLDYYARATAVEYDEDPNDASYG